VTFLRKRAQVDGVPVAEQSALHELAERGGRTVRTLEGSFIRVVARQSLIGQPMTTGIVADTLGPSTVPAAAVPTIERVQDAVCEAFGISRNDLVSMSRAARVVWPRHLAIYLARELTGETLPVIGRQFGGRSHNTVINACRQAGQRIDRDTGALALAGDLRERLRAG
jgi:chromosomal replication initiator protein